MSRAFRTVAGLLFALAAATGPAGAADDYEAPILEGLGDYVFPVSTENEMAQRFVTQGVLLTHGFNHPEAERSFREAARLDPKCAMAWWGVALVLGPNINLEMQPEAVAPAWEAIRNAEKHAKNASPKEKDYVAALKKRYQQKPPENRSGLDQAYADAMRDLRRKYPDDVDVAAFTAEALMDLHPWNFWNADGTPHPWTPEIVELLEWALTQRPDHPLANHLYIHAVEGSKDPARALDSAARLRKLMPGAGHMVHMPSHIYIRTGRYHEGTLANELAVQSDEEYATQCHAQGVYMVAYVPHNHHFLWAMASIEGASEKAMRAAQTTAEHVVHEALGVPGLEGLQHFLSIPYFARVRFGKWDEMLAQESPGDDLVYVKSAWHYCRAMAYARTGRLEEAAKEKAEMERLAADPRLDAVRFFGLNELRTLLGIGSLVLEGEMKAYAKDYDGAVAAFTKAIDQEDHLRYIEPPDWFFPVRHNLGAVLLEAGRPAEAEKVYRQDLVTFPENGWSLFGLSQSLRAQGDFDGAREVEARFYNAWTNADVTLASSRF
ncbi:MAG: tetratricopeptide repeat protein [Gammaproteobacteria bacterium]